jgi:hypothetical protein
MTFLADRAAIGGLQSARQFLFARHASMDAENRAAISSLTSRRESPQKPDS